MCITYLLIFIAVAQKPDPSVSETENRLPVTVVMDRITDPWTAGVLLRTAHGVGCRGFVTTKGSKKLIFFLLSNLVYSRYCYSQLTICSYMYGTFIYQIFNSFI